MRISVVTVSYNQARYLAEALGSVLGQGYPDLEYVVVDGGSTDGSRDVIERHADRLAWWCSEPDAGPAAALNKGVARCTGDVLGVLNADDRLLPGALAAVADHFRRHPDTDVLSGHGVEIDADGRSVRPLYSDRWSLRRYVHGRCVLVQPATFVRRERVVAAGGFNEDNRTSWDGELWVDLALRGARWRRIGRPLAAFRVHPASITGSGARLHQYRADHAALAERVRTGASRSRLGPPLARLEQVLTDPLLVARRAWARLQHARR